MPSPPPVMVVTSAVVEELQRPLLVREEELNSRESAIVTWEDEHVTVEHTLGKVCVECNAAYAQTEVV
jgi:hypothetical protein